MYSRPNTLLRRGKCGGGFPRKKSGWPLGGGHPHPREWGQGHEDPRGAVERGSIHPEQNKVGGLHTCIFSDQRCRLLWGAPFLSPPVHLFLPFLPSAPHHIGLLFSPSSPPLPSFFPHSSWCVEAGPWGSFPGGPPSGKPHVPVQLSTPAQSCREVPLAPLSAFPVLSASPADFTRSHCTPVPNTLLRQCPGSAARGQRCCHARPYIDTSSGNPSAMGWQPGRLLGGGPLPLPPTGAGLCMQEVCTLLPTPCVLEHRIGAPIGRAKKKSPKVVSPDHHRKNHKVK